MTWETYWTESRYWTLLLRCSQRLMRREMTWLQEKIG